MRKEQYFLLLPVLFLIVFALILTVPGVPVISGLSFAEKASLLLTFSLAFFAAVEGFSTYRRSTMEFKRHAIEDARNELEKAYGPLYTLLNKHASGESEKKGFWLDFEDRRRLDDIMATYPFMFPPKIYDLWQEKLRNVESLLGASDFKSGTREVSLGGYLEFRNLINEEYALRVKNYRKLLGE